MSGYDHRFARGISDYSAQIPAPGLSAQAPFAAGFNDVEPHLHNFDDPDAQYRNIHTFDTTTPFQTNIPDEPSKWEQNKLTEHIPCAALTITSPPGIHPAGTGVELGVEAIQAEPRMHTILTGLRDLIQILDLSGILLSVSPCCKALTGYEPEDLIGNVLFEFIHPDDRSMVVKEFAHSINTKGPFQCYYRFKKYDGTYILLDAHGQIDSATNMELSIIARPYLTKETQLLDSFLEHKIENERLTRRIAELKREGEFQLHNDENKPDNEQVTSIAPQAHRNSATTPSFHSLPTSEFQFRPTLMPNPEVPILPNELFTESSSDVFHPLTPSQPQHNISQSAGFEGSTYLDDIELMTGLRYGAGERARGISTGDPNGTLFQSDALSVGVFTASRGNGGKAGKGTAERKRRSKPAETNSCTDCGTFSSPEWRKGPNGKKTLCNACGLRWAKQVKKR
ncbi:hypothetical protein ACJ73_03734 [Blastomyces percursus]|uniref:Blue light regulator 2 n=1 Tax=Blastomyces percursus TaxID=1658174 RepID=A0A1J9R8R4_9EURO|nr:hypothetical protein ACJ73_03734 [Blastomyces percursus]